MRLPTAILTVNRPKGYLDQTIKSLEETGFFNRNPDPLRLVAGGPDCAHLERYREDIDRYNIWEWTDRMKDEQGIKWEAFDGSQRCTFGHVGALKLMRSLARANDWREVLLLEDDLKFAKHWWSLTQMAIESIRKQTPGPSWILKLCRFNPLVAQKYPDTKWGVYGIDPAYHMGMQATVYPTGLIDRLIGFIDIEEKRQPNLPTESLISLYAKNSGVKVFMISPSVVQHVGKVSQLGRGLPMCEATDFLGDDDVQKITE